MLLVLAETRELKRQRVLLMAHQEFGDSPADPTPFLGTMRETKETYGLIPSPKGFISLCGEGLITNVNHV